MEEEVGPVSELKTSTVAGPLEDARKGTSMDAPKGKGTKCYVCKQRNHHPGFFCRECDLLNQGKRQAATDMTGKVCVVTGCRVKIGYQAALSLLRMGATVVGTTRFPDDAFRRFAAEPDGAVVIPRLRLHRMDMMCMADITAFTNTLHANYEGGVHVVINNAAQTIRRPPAFYQHLMSGGLMSSAVITDSVGDRMLIPAEAASPPSATEPSDVVLPEHFPQGQLDEHGQQLDLRPENSWTQRMGEIDPLELVECLVINAAAPFILVQNLLGMLRAASGDKFVVNASAMEGKFYRNKTPFHPHTNMAKAALNQWVRTSSGQLAKENIFMTAVDTGWVTDERPHRYQQKAPHEIPLDCKDGAMRLLHPIIEGYSGGQLFHGVFLKDYKITSW
jgi:NAD(P)-dependent dehydrogenase (short-subunit alcohol dehydrogenase family)